MPSAAFHQVLRPTDCTVLTLRSTLHSSDHELLCWQASAHAVHALVHGRKGVK